jgi:colicin import membrane protein
MSDEPAFSGSEALDTRIEEAQRRLRDAAESAADAERRATAEIRALEADLEKERLRAAEQLERLRESRQQELLAEREAKEKAIASAGERLAEIEAHAEAAEQRVDEAERRADEAERKFADAHAHAREAAASWLREQISEIRREAAGR